MSKEIWKNVASLENSYQVSNFGNVRSKDRYVKNPFGTKNLRVQQLMKQTKDKDGYKRLQLTYKHERYDKRVHRLVAEAFIPNPENKPFINHKDGVKDNNHVDNLEWVTASENTRHAYKTGLHKGRSKYEFLCNEYEEWGWLNTREMSQKIRDILNPKGKLRTTMGVINQDQKYYGYTFKKRKI